MRRALATAATAATAALAVLAVLAAPSPLALGAQGQPGSGALISRALEHENGGRHAAALDAWRAVIASGAIVPGALGIERVLSMLGDEVRFLPIVDSLITQHPAEAQLRSAQLRTMVQVGQETEADRAFAAWRDLRPHDVAPYRDYARVLLFNNRAAKADSVLTDAASRLGQSRALLLESAQMRAALGRWKEAAEAWRETLRDYAHYEAAAAFSLAAAPADARDAVRAELTVSGAPIGARQALAQLELGWGSPIAGWRVIADLPPSDTVVAVWRAFAEEAERAQAWGAVRDALRAVYAARGGARVAERGAAAALRANDPRSALELVRSARIGSETPWRADVVGIELDALARLGRGADAERLWRAAAAELGPTVARGYSRTVAWAWIRAGDVARARAALVDAPLDAEDAVEGWLALFDGDLAAARRALRHGDVQAPEAVEALALLTRTRAAESRDIGQAFLAVARGDSSAAVAAYLRAAGTLGDARSLLLTMAARLETARGGDGRALPLWRQVATEHAASVEAPEARLEWGRALRRRGDAQGAREQFEHLIIAYPTSALVPQARRELDALPAGRAEAR